jgi:hypothetical protein
LSFLISFVLLIVFLATFLAKNEAFNQIRVYAQQDYPLNNQPSSNSNQLVYNQESLNQDIRQLKIQYRSELEEYRQLENQHQLAQKQYQQLQTLTSLEKSVRATQKAVTSRDKVLSTYLKLLRLSLLSQPGISVSQKQVLEKELQSVVKKIDQHQQNLSKDLDRSALSAQIALFSQLSAEIESTAYHTLSLLSLGKLQTINDKAQILKDDMQSSLATASGGLKSQQRKRFFSETQQSLDNLKILFDKIETVLAEPGMGGYKSSYRSIQDVYQEVYLGLLKVSSYLEELLVI